MSTTAKLSPSLPLTVTAGVVGNLTSRTLAYSNAEADLASQPKTELVSGRFVFALEPRRSAPMVRMLIDGAAGALVKARVKAWHRVSTGKTTWYTPTHVCDIEATAATLALTVAVDDFPAGLRWGMLTIPAESAIAPGAQVVGASLADSATSVVFDSADAEFITIDIQNPVSTKSAPLVLGLSLA